MKGGHDDAGNDVYICRVVEEFQRKNYPFPVSVRYLYKLKILWIILEISSIGIMHPGDKVCYFSNRNQNIVAIKHYDLLITKPTTYDDNFNEKGKKQLYLI